MIKYDCPYNSIQKSSFVNSPACFSFQVSSLYFFHTSSSLLYFIPAVCKNNSTQVNKCDVYFLPSLVGPI